MPTYEIDPMPAQISAEVVALLEQTETATVGHWRHWGFCDRGIQPLLRRRRVAGTAVTLAIPGPDSTLLHHALGLLRPGDILVVDRLGDTRHACWGGGVTVAAKAAGAKAGAGMRQGPGRHRLGHLRLRLPAMPLRGGDGAEPDQRAVPHLPAAGLVAALVRGPGIQHRAAGRGGQEPAAPCGSWTGWSASPGRSAAPSRRLRVLARCPAMEGA